MPKANAFQKVEKVSPLATQTLTPETSPNSSQSASFWRVALLMAGTVIVGSLVGMFSSEKLSFFYKEQLHLSASAFSSLVILLAIPNYLRPVIGAGSDLFPLFGYHRRSYYMLAALLGAIGYFSLSLQTHPSYWTTALLVMVTVAGAVTLLIMADTVMVTVGNKTGTVGRLQAIQQFVPFLLSLTFTARVSGYVTQHWSYAACFRSAALIALLALPLAFLIEEKRTHARQQQHETSEMHLARLEAKRLERQRGAKALGQAAKSPGLWAILAYVFYLTLTPSGSTAQFYFMVDHLHFSKQFIGNLGQYGAGGVLLGILTFAAISRKISVRTLIWTGWFIGTVAYLLNFALQNQTSAEIISFVGGFFGIIGSFSLVTLAARACPPGIEGTIYALFIASIGLASTVSDKISSSLYDFYGPAHHHSVVYGWHMMTWWGFGLTALAAGLILLMPAWTRSRLPLSAKPEVAA
jgi:MFS family permease